MILLATYELRQHERDYLSVRSILTTADSYCNPMPSVWLLDTTAHPYLWVYRLRAAADSSDEFFVIRISSLWTAFNTHPEMKSWLLDSSRRW